jgi:hypothetical protein
LRTSPATSLSRDTVWWRKQGHCAGGFGAIEKDFWIFLRFYISICFERDIFKKYIGEYANGPH